MTGKSFRNNVLGPVCLTAGIAIPVVKIVLRDQSLAFDDVTATLILVASGLAMIDTTILVIFGRVVAKFLPWGNKTVTGDTMTLTKDDIEKIIRKRKKK